MPEPFTKSYLHPFRVCDFEVFPVNVDVSMHWLLFLSELDYEGTFVLQDAGALAQSQRCHTVDHAELKHVVVVRGVVTDCLSRDRSALSIHEAKVFVPAGVPEMGTAAHHRVDVGADKGDRVTS